MAEREDRPRGAQGEGGEIPAPDPGQLRLLKSVVIVLGVLILLALMALVAGIVFKSQKTAGGALRGQWLTPLAARTEAGEEMGAMTLDGDRLVVQMRKTGGGGEILIFDLRKKGLMGRIRLTPEK